MPIAGKPLQSRLLRLAAPGVLAACLATPLLAGETLTTPLVADETLTTPMVAADTDPAERLLASLHPDYRNFVSAVRPLPEGAGIRASVYMVLVRSGATDATSHASAPLAGRGARNDILYDPAVFRSGRSSGWMQLLLDHEYFHARHLAGQTTIPLPARSGANRERHWFEAAAWGWSVAQARAGRYEGLKESEFREALDRYGDHLRALRPAGSFAPVSMPAAALLPAAPAPPAGSGPTPAIR